MAKNFEKIQQTINRLKDLGLPAKTVDNLNAWLEGERAKEEPFAGLPNHLQPSGGSNEKLPEQTTER